MFKKMKRTMWIEFLGASLSILVGQWVSLQICFYFMIGLVITMNLSILIHLEAPLNETLNEKRTIKKADERELKSAQYNLDNSMIA